jgi:hypothetical protein
MPDTKPTVVLDLNGEEGNAYVVLGRTAAALKEVNPDAAAEYVSRATGGDYDNLLAVTREYVDLIDTGEAVRFYLEYGKGDSGDND